MRGSQDTTLQDSHRVWLPPVAGPWCYVSAVTEYIKSANGESLARDEGDGSNLFMEVATYTTVQGCQLSMRMTPATASIFPVCGCSCDSCEQYLRAPKGHGGVQGFQAGRVPQDTMRDN